MGVMTDVAVIGAGPYGLSLAAHLRARGADIRVFGFPMQSWRDSMPVGMKLKLMEWLRLERLTRQKLNGRKSGRRCHLGSWL